MMEPRKEIRAYQEIEIGDDLISASQFLSEIESFREGIIYRFGYEPDNNEIKISSYGDSSCIFLRFDKMLPNVKYDEQMQQYQLYLKQQEESRIAMQKTAEQFRRQKASNVIALICGDDDPRSNDDDVINKIKDMF